MQLNLKEYPITGVEWGSETKYDCGKMIVSKDAILDFLEENGDLENLEVTDLDIVQPNVPIRVINIFDVFPAHSRLGKNASNYPGFLGPMQAVGDGCSASLTNFSILAISSKPGRYNKVLDKDGESKEYSAYGDYFHIAVKAMPKNESMTSPEYYYYLKKIALRIGTFLAQKAEETATEEVAATVYEMTELEEKKPRVVFICMLAALQNWEKGEAILYGNDLENMLPTILHPNELLDGAMVAQNFNLGVDTYSFQKNAIINELYSRHGEEIEFGGVVAVTSHITREARERSVQMTVKLACDTLKADMAILNKVGGGIPESDVLMTIEELEKRGVKTSAVMWSHQGNGTIEDILTAYSPVEDALVSIGINDAAVTLPEQKEVVGGEFLNPLSDDPDAKPQPAKEEVTVRFREICGAINQLGSSKVCMLEI